MEYDDFSLSQNFEKMASEYYKALNKKGFVFLRLDEQGQEKLKLVNQTLEQLAYYENMLQMLKRYNSKMIIDLRSITEFQKNNLAKMYAVPLPNVQQKTVFPNIQNIISHEAQILKSLFVLMELEDNHDKHITIKNMLTSRLDILAN